MKKRETEKLGSFEVISGTIVASDPCYEIPTWCQGLIENCKKGKWNAEIVKSDEDDWGVRSAELIVCKDGEKGLTFDNWKMQDFEAGVDSGTFGFYDIDHYRDDSIVTDDMFEMNDVISVPDLNKEDGIREYHVHKSSWRPRKDDDEDGNRWYHINGAKTLGCNAPVGIYKDVKDVKMSLGGVIPFGAVSSSGFGDGGYTCYTIENEDGQVVAIKVVFIGEDENDDWDDEI